MSNTVLDLFLQWGLLNITIMKTTEESHNINSTLGKSCLIMGFVGLNMMVRRKRFPMKD